MVEFCSTFFCLVVLRYSSNISFGIFMSCFLAFLDHFLIFFVSLT